MKGKPPLKKSKLDPHPLETGGRASPSTSSTSSCSLLSIPPPTSSSSSSSKADLVAVAKAVTCGVKQQMQQRAAASAAASSGIPGYPTYIHGDLKELQRINVLINCPKGGPSSDGKPLVLGPEGILTMDDLDSLQTELETLWSATALRTRSLRVDQSVLQNASATTSNVVSVLGEHYDPHHQEKLNAVASLLDAGHQTRTSVSAAAKLVMGAQGGGSSGPGGGGTGTPITKKTATGVSRLDKLPKKKCKGETGSVAKKGGEKPARATQNRTHSVSSDFGLDGFYKHEAPNEFWEFADSYCGQITQEHLDDLTEIIDEHKELPESLFEIPPLGKHWKDGEGRSGKHKGEKGGKRTDTIGPLTQRLVAALVDERVAMYNHHRHGLGSPKEELSTNGSHSNSHEFGGFIHRAGLIKALGLDGSQGSTKTPDESQIRQCLLDRGFLSPEDANDPLLTDPDDEILTEIRRTQNTLKKLHNYNYEKLQDLYTKAKREFDNIPLKSDLEAVDKEVLDAYKIIAGLKQKRKPVTKKEKDLALKVLEKRDKALQKLTLKSPDVNITAPLRIDV